MPSTFSCLGPMFLSRSDPISVQLICLAFVSFQVSPYLVHVSVAPLTLPSLCFCHNIPMYLHLPYDTTINLFSLCISFLSIIFLFLTVLPYLPNSSLQHLSLTLHHVSVQPITIFWFSLCIWHMSLTHRTRMAQW